MQHRVPLSIRRAVIVQLLLQLYQLPLLRDERSHVKVVAAAVCQPLIIVVVDQMVQFLTLALAPLLHLLKQDLIVVESLELLRLVVTILVIVADHIITLLILILHRGRSGSRLRLFLLRRLLTFITIEC